MKPPAENSKEAQVKNLRLKRATEQRRTPPTPAAPAGAEPKETTMATKTAKKTVAKAISKAARSSARRSPPTKAPAAKPAPKAASAGPKAHYDWKGAELGAAEGRLPPALNFAAACNKPYLGKLAELERLAKAKDVAALRKINIPSYNASSKALGRWRDMAVTALSA